MNRMLSELDRNGVYLRRAEEFQNEMNGTLFGIGVILQVSDKFESPMFWLEVLQTRAEFPQMPV